MPCRRDLPEHIRQLGRWARCLLAHMRARRRRPVHRARPDAERRRRLAPILLYPSRHMGLGRLPRRSGSPIIARARGRERELPGCRQYKGWRPSETPRLLPPGSFLPGGRTATATPGPRRLVRLRSLLRTAGSGLSSEWRGEPARRNHPLFLFLFPGRHGPRSRVALTGRLSPCADVAPGECRARA